MSDATHTYDVQVDWPTVVPLGDTLAVRTEPGCDDRWVEAFEVVLDEQERQATDWKWGGIDFEYRSGDDDARFVLYVRRIEPEAQSEEVRGTLADLVQATNAVAQVGTHVYELARELREPAPETPRGSVPPPSYDPLAEDELDADAA